MEGTFLQEIHEFAAHSQRSRLSRQIGLVLVSHLLSTGLMFGCLAISIGILHLQINLSSLLLAIVLLVLFFALFLVGGFLQLTMLPYTISTFRRLVSRNPALVVTQQGLELHDVPVVGTLSLSWDEVASLSPGVMDHLFESRFAFFNPSGHLCCGLKDDAQFLSRFSPRRRVLIICFCAFTTGTLIHLPVWFFSEPVSEILSQIQATFQEQLQAHEVQVLCSLPEKGVAQDANLAQIHQQG